TPRRYAPMGGSLAPVRVAGFTWNGWQPSAVYADSSFRASRSIAEEMIPNCKENPDNNARKSNPFSDLGNSPKSNLKDAVKAASFLSGYLRLNKPSEADGNYQVADKTQRQSTPPWQSCCHADNISYDAEQAGAFPSSVAPSQSSTPFDLTPGSRAGLEPRSGGKSVAVQPIVKSFGVRYPDHDQHPVQEQSYGCH
ncbi:hypothetical protein, partial [Marinobacter sp.]|uniref:hypothetical protein n=1 Tax=Marinobacter sp. TaxID=50741 RepID=UPI0035653F6D